MEKYTVKLIDHNNGYKVFNEGNFGTIKEVRQWAKGKAFGLRYTVEVYNNFNNTFKEKYVTN